MQVVKNHPDWPNPYNGITAIRHGDIDRDVGIYLAESEQRSCALAAVSLDQLSDRGAVHSSELERDKVNSIVLSSNKRVQHGTASCARQLEVI